MTIFSKVALVCAIVCAFGCGQARPERPSPGSEGREAEPASHEHGGGTPGSHEDWCSEHEVPESQCTRCNPSLIPAFQATGDWCAEHGLPESQCKICNPNLHIERPAG